MAKQIVVGIHQPNFFPWLGFFDKMVRSDIFIFLDHVQIPKNGGSAVNRVKILFCDGKARWVTLPIKRCHGVQSINDVIIDSSMDWKRSFATKLSENYKTFEYYDEVYAFVEPIIMNNEENLAEYNLHAITTFVEKLGLKTKFIRGSYIPHEGMSNEMLISLIKHVGGTVYLAGNGATYMDDHKYASNNISVVYQNFEHPVYRQHKNKPFVKGLSVIDAMMHVGFDGVKDIIMRNSSNSFDHHN
jgi:hypothetical protein